jgi:hypothetical protein
MAEVIPLHRDELRFSGGELPHASSNVWGIQIFASPGKKAHFWRRDPHGYRRECDGYVSPAFLDNGQASIFGAGTFPKCKRCMNRLTKP